MNKNVQIITILLFLIALAGTTNAAAPPTGNLKSFYNGSQSGGLLLDLMGRVNLTSNVTSYSDATSGYFGSASSANYASSTNSPVQGVNFSIHFWIKTTDTGINYRPITFGENAVDKLVNTYINFGGSDIQALSTAGGLIVSQSSRNFNDDTWQCWSATYNSAGTGTIYIGGASPVTGVRSINVSTGLFQIFNDGFIGYITALAIYNATHTDSQVADYCNEGRGYNPTPATPAATITFQGQTPNNGQKYYNNGSIQIKINTTVANTGGTINQTHYIFNGSGTLIYRYNQSDTNNNYTTTTTITTSGIYYFNATSVNGSQNATSENRTFRIYTLNAGNITTPANMTNQSTRYLNISWTNATDAPSNTVNITQYEIRIYESNATTLNRYLYTTNNLSYYWDTYATALPTGLYWLDVRYNDSTGNTTASNKIAINITTNALLNITLEDGIGGLEQNYTIQYYEGNNSDSTTTETATNVTYIILDVIRNKNYTIIVTSPITHEGKTEEANMTALLNNISIEPYMLTIAFDKNVTGIIEYYEDADEGATAVEEFTGIQKIMVLGDLPENLIRIRFSATTLTEKYVQYYEFINNDWTTRTENMYVINQTDYIPQYVQVKRYPDSLKITEAAVAAYLANATNHKNLIGRRLTDTQGLTSFKMPANMTSGTNASNRGYYVASKTGYATTTKSAVVKDIDTIYETEATAIELLLTETENAVITDTYAVTELFYDNETTRLYIDLYTLGTNTEGIIKVALQSCLDAASTTAEEEACYCESDEGATITRCGLVPTTGLSNNNETIVITTYDSDGVGTTRTAIIRHRDAIWVVAAPTNATLYDPNDTMLQNNPTLTRIILMISAIFIGMIGAITIKKGIEVFIATILAMGTILGDYWLIMPALIFIIPTIMIWIIKKLNGKE